MSGFSIVVGQQIIVDEETASLLNEMLEDNGVQESVFEADIFNVSQFRVELVLEIDEFRDRYNTNQPDMFRKIYVTNINQKLRHDTREFFIEKAYNNVSKDGDHDEQLINLDYKLTEADIQMLENEMISKYWVLNENLINEEIKIFKNLTHKSNYELSNRVIRDRFLELHDESFLERFDNKSYRQTYIQEARQEFLEKATKRYITLSDDLIEESEYAVEDAYMDWLEHYDRIKLLQLLNDAHELNKHMDVELELPADMPDYSKMDDKYTSKDQQDLLDRYRDVHMPNGSHVKVQSDPDQAQFQNKFLAEYRESRKAMKSASRVSM